MCQFGPTAELPRPKHRRASLQGLSARPDWRITCFFVASAYRRRGVASAALEGALAEIARRGGGTVESYPEDSAGRLLRRVHQCSARVPSLRQRRSTRRNTVAPTNPMTTMKPSEIATSVDSGRIVRVCKREPRRASYP